MSPLFRWVVKWSRTAHLYLSLVGLGLLLLFAVTGFTLNHEDWFLPRAEERTATAPCEVPAEWVADPERHELAIVEHLRRHYGRHVVGSLNTSDDAGGDALGELPAKRRLLDVTDETVRAVFKRPGSQVTVDLYRIETEAPGDTPEQTRTFQPGQGEITYTKSGLVVFLNDLHRGKDTSGVWRVVIDAVAVLMVLVSATGIVLWLSLKGRGRFGWAVTVTGVAAAVALVVVFELWLVRG